MDASAPKTILVPVDFGEASARAVAAGGALAWRCGAELRLLHAEPLDAPAYFTHEQVQAMAAQRQRMRTQAEEFLGRFGRQHTSHPFTTVLESQTPAEAILHHESWADLLVMGTHGRHGPRRWWLGSVAERVLRETVKPLLIVRAADAVDALFSRVLVHASPPLVGAETARYAAAVAVCMGGTVVEARHEPIDAAIKRTNATMLAAATPQPHDPVWLSNIGEPLIRFATVPTLFVPESRGSRGSRGSQGSGRD
ncbi:MAG: universal stress protein [Betaproteobacteria bacterium]